MCMQQQHQVHNKFHYYFPQKRCRVRVLGLSRRQSREQHVEMELKNLRLYLENMSILTENEKLRNQAHKLHQENLALSSELQNKFSKSQVVSFTLNMMHVTSSNNG